MRRITLGVLSLVSAGAFVACGDDDGGTPNPGGSGGSAGASGGSNAGNGGSGGVGTGGNAGSPGGNGGGGAGPGPAVTCTGCAEITIPFTGAGQVTYQIARTAPATFDLSGATVEWNIQVLTPTASATIKPQLQNGAVLAYAGYYDAPAVALTAANFPAGVWTPVALNASTIPAVAGGGSDAGADAGDAGAAPATGFDKSTVEAIQLQIAATAAGSVTVVIDALEVTNGGDYTGATFNAGLETFQLNMYANPELIPAGTPAVAAH